ncbi:replicative DNA helicase [Herbiconiux sp. UC225_62]|uniref:replicative DNA helicase n=1 Tax=Herbiconiux sp. UC225_62 TaxID=3350168 RepID=UPI0036D3966A
MLDTYSDIDAPAEEGGREQPFDLLAERYVLGSMLLTRDAVDDVFDEMTIHDFYVPKHQVIAESITRLFAAGAPTDPISVNDDLTKHGQLAHAGGPAEVFDLQGAPSTAASAGYYARLVHEHAVRRRVIESANRMMQSAYNRDRDVADVVEAARLEVDMVETGRRRSVRMVGETIDQLAEKLDEKPTYMPTPWTSIDRIIGGFAPGSLYVIAARPGSGKTIALLQSAIALARVGTVAFSSIEMAEEELQKRLIAQYGPLHQTILRNHALTKSDWETFAQARARIIGAPIAIDDRGAVTVADIRTHARATARRGKLAGIAVDYLQLVEGEGQDRRVVVDNVSRALKQLAKDFNVPVIAAAQLRRAQPQKGKQRVLPTLADLREAGGIEQNADVVMLLDRGVEKEARDLTVVVAKNRHGEEKQVTLRWEAEYARVVDRKWSPTALIDEDELRREQ